MLIHCLCPRRILIVLCLITCILLLHLDINLYRLIKQPVYFPTNLDNLCFLPTWKDDLPDQERRCFGRCCLSNETQVEKRLACIYSCKPSLYDNYPNDNQFFHFLPINIIPETKKKIISYSLYGSKKRYLLNALSILAENRRIYPGWIIRFYVGADVPPLTINRFVNEGCEVIAVYMKSTSLVDSYHGMFWRFFVADDPNVSRYIIRDADTWPIQREKDAVYAWIQNGTGFHVMRDHQEHNIEILGGMWGGVVDPMVLNVSRLYGQAMMSKRFRWSDGLGIDQIFLREFIWPIVRANMTCHTSHRFWFINDTGCQPFPTPRQGDEFVGKQHLLPNSS